LMHYKYLKKIIYIVNIVTWKLIIVKEDLMRNVLLKKGGGFITTII
jgi:hypothetical protein